MEKLRQDKTMRRDAMQCQSTTQLHSSQLSSTQINMKDRVATLQMVAFSILTG
jgi:hypothetical protein